MAVFKVNIFNNWENIIHRKAFSSFSADNPRIKNLSKDLWSELDKIKKGNVLLLCKGNIKIFASAFAKDDCRITDVDAYSDKIVYEEKGFRYIEFELIHEFLHPLDGKEYFKGLLQDDVFESNMFCSELIPLKNRDLKFTSSINNILQAE